MQLLTFVFLASKTLTNSKSSAVLPATRSEVDEMLVVHVCT